MAKKKTKKPAKKVEAPRLTSFEIEAAEFWDGVAREYGIEDRGGLGIIRMGREALVNLWWAEILVRNEGMCVTDRFGQKKGHPLLPVMRDSRAQVLACLKMLNLDLEPLRDLGRPPGS